MHSKKNSELTEYSYNSGIQRGTAKHRLNIKHRTRSYYNYYKNMYKTQKHKQHSAYKSNIVSNITVLGL